MSDDKKLTVTGHLGELRKRLLRAMVVVGITTTVSFVFSERYLFPLLTRPTPPGIELIFIKLTEMIGTYIKLSLVAGLVLALPYLLYELVMFVSPALTRREKTYFYTLLPASILAFVAGAAFCYFFFLPPALNFLFSFGSGVATPQITIGNYIDVVSMLLFWIGIAFEIPLVIFFLSKIGVVTPQGLSRKRRWAVLAAFILGAIITPTVDPVNQSIVAGSIIVLYEVGILLSRLAWRGKKRLVTAPLEQD